MGKNNGKTLYPLDDRVYIKINERSKVSKGGIIIPDMVDNNENEKQWGEVIAIGPNVFDVHPGDQVMFGRYAGQEATLDESPHVVLREEEIIAVDLAA